MQVSPLAEHHQARPPGVVRPSRPSGSRDYADFLERKSRSAGSISIPWRRFSAGRARLGPPAGGCKRRGRVREQFDHLGAQRGDRHRSRLPSPGFRLRAADRPRRSRRQPFEGSRGLCGAPGRGREWSQLGRTGGASLGVGIGGLLHYWDAGQPLARRDAGPAVATSRSWDLPSHARSRHELHRERRPGRAHAR